jgi:hypothetical protein
VIAHIVLFDVKEGLTTERLRLFARMFSLHAKLIPGIRRVTVGRSMPDGPVYYPSIGVSTYQLAAVLEFDDKQGLDGYLKHPLHVELGRSLWEVSERAAVVDIETLDLEAVAEDDFLAM